MSPRAWPLHAVSAFLAFGTVLAALPPPSKVSQPPPPAPGAFNKATQAALLDLKAAVGAGVKPAGALSSWIAGSSCTKWAYITCNKVTGSLLSLSLVGLQLRGAIPSSFYNITTLTSLDLHNNQLYGSVRRDLGLLNPGLVYLDLSNNLFSGPWPDQFSGSIPFVNGLPGITVNVANNFFSGFYSINVHSSDAMVAGFWCVGSDLAGSTNSTCAINNPGLSTGIDPAVCPQPGGQVAVPDSVCAQWCGTNTAEGFCQQAPAADCIPSFASASSTTILSRSCKARNPLPAVPSPPVAPPPKSINPSDLTALLGIKSGFKQPGKVLSTWTNKSTCASLAPRVTCNAQGAVTGLDLSSLGLYGSLPTYLWSLSSLTKLVLKNNSFYGPAMLTSSLPLQYLDLSDNFFSGRVPSGFAVPKFGYRGLPLFVNISNNFFFGDPAIRDAPPTAPPNTYCPPAAQRPVAATNCLTPTLNSPCPAEAQRSAAECRAFCGISAAYPWAGACQDGAAGICVPPPTALPLAHTASPVPGVCSSIAPPPPPQGSPVFVVAGNQFLEFALTYQFKGYLTWDPSVPCAQWKGLKCDTAGNAIALNLSGTGLSGLIPAGKWDDLLWSNKAVAQKIKIIDLSNNKLFGPIPPSVANRMGLDYLDLSRNYLTGALPAVWQGTYKFLGLGSNYLRHSPALVGQDYRTQFCAGRDFEGSLGNNCFTLTAAPRATCPRAPVLRSLVQCNAFCTGRNACPAGKYCKPRTSTTFICSAS